MDTEGLRSAARCVFIATSEDAAKDLSQRLNWAADEIDRLRAENTYYRTHKTGLLTAVKVAYRKHYLNDDSIGWAELGDYLLNAICNAVGDEEYVKWLAEVHWEKEE